MDRNQALLILEALRRGDKKAIVDFMRMKAALGWRTRFVCEHCGERAMPLAPGFDFDELTVTAECSLCGRPNRLPLKSWGGTGSSQSPS